MLPKDNRKKKDARKLAKKDKDPINKSRANANKSKVQDKLTNQVPKLQMTNSVRKSPIYYYYIIISAVVSERLKILVLWPRKPFRRQIGDECMDG